MPQVSLIASDRVLTWTALKGWLAPSQEDVDAWSYTTTKAQMEARKASTDVTSDAYHDAMMMAYQQIGWRVDGLGAYGYAQQPSTPVTPAQIMVDALRAASPRRLRAIYDPADMLETLLERLKSPPPRVRAFLDWYVSNAHVSETVQHMAMGPLISIFGTPNMLIVHYTLIAKIDGWESWFRPYDHSSILVRAKFATMRLNMGDYRAHKESLRRELTGATLQHIRRTTLEI
ncbi:hypothetical protein WME97_45560 [Sorangium sp. So ce367]|uniref:hypothetical protein n=1 Tax=Sorangium sp. So ce367 TaxID=3133305 RepID=UPI003F6292A4